MSDTRICVYTVLTGQYEQLNEQPVAARSVIPFLCLTDDLGLRSTSWQVRQIAPLFGMDPVRSQRDFKLRPHLHLPEFDASLYIDNSVLLSELPERLFELLDPARGFCLLEHSFRETVLDEFLEVAELGLDDQGRIFEQLNHYIVDCPQVLQERPYWCGLLLRDHRNPAVRAMLEIWLAHVQRYSRRDQLSVNLAFRRAGLTPLVLQIDNYSSWFHSWPHALGRKRNAHRTAVSLSPPVAQIRKMERALSEHVVRNEAMEHAVAKHVERNKALEHAVAEHVGRNRVLEQALSEQVALHNSVLASTTWRVMAPIRHFAQCYPNLAQFLRRGLMRLARIATLQVFLRRAQIRAGPVPICDAASAEPTGLAESPRKHTLRTDA